MTWGNNMRTVKDFKDAGLVFVVDDVSRIVGCGRFRVTQIWTVNVTNTDRYDAQEIVEFKWRDNTGIRPAFTGKFDIQFPDGKVALDVAPRDLTWALEGAYGDITRWRPHLPKPVQALTASKDTPEIDKGEKYQVTIRNRHSGETLKVDTYDMIEALGITCPAMAHAFKKIANAGKRGHKDYDMDCNEAINSIEQSKKLQKGRT